MINVIFTPSAFMKIQTLVSGYDHEVGWYGTVDKVSDDTYKITDILVYPQYASAAYIDDADTTEMPVWFASLTDEQINHRRFHGHSHVNMGCYPSGTDNSTYEQFKAQNAAATENRFSLSLIINKRFEMHWRFHDAETNTELTNKDINVEIEIMDGLTQAAYFEESRSLVKQRLVAKNFLMKGKPSFVKEKKAQPYKYGGYGAKTPSSKVKDDEYWNNFWNDYYGDGYDDMFGNGETEQDKKEESKENEGKKEEFKAEKVDVPGSKFIITMDDTTFVAKEVTVMAEDSRVIYDTAGNAYKMIDNSTTFSDYGLLLDYMLDFMKDEDRKAKQFAIFDTATKTFKIMTKENIVENLNLKVFGTELQPLKDGGKVYIITV